MRAGQTDLTETVRVRLEAQRSAFRRHPPEYAERMHALARLEQALLRDRKSMLDAVARDFGGRAPEETQMLELVPVLEEIRHARRRLKHWMEPQRMPVRWPFWPGRARVVYQPLGVVGIIAPWNYPVFLSLAPLVGALAAGNHAILKPSEWAPHTATWLERMLADVYPPEYVTVLTGEAEAASALASLPLDHLLFTGSARVGKLVMQAAAANLTPVTLELGGKCPAIVHGSFPLREAATKIAAGKLYNAGQTCVAPDYVLAPRQRFAEFVDELRGAMTRLYGDGRDYTRIIHTRHYDRLAGLVADARSHGAHVQEIGEADREAKLYPPTLLTAVDDRMAAMREEIFGPVLPVVAYGEPEEAMEYVNARPRPLALYYFDRGSRRIAAMTRGTTAGGMTVNDCIFHVGQVNLPFGGVGASGMGRYHGFDGFETFSAKKGIFLQGRVSAVALLRPPYGEGTRRILRFLTGK